MGREWQMGTIQLDFQLPQRFELVYTASDGTKQAPIMIHRALFGSFDRFIGIITEHFAGAFPIWLAPEQVRILTIAEKFTDYAQEVAAKLDKAGIRCEIDNRNETIGKKIREAQMQKLPYTLVVGENEVANGTVAVRKRAMGDQGAQSVDEFIARITAEVESRAIN